jgi:hypothetical protein
MKLIVDSSSTTCFPNLQNGLTKEGNFKLEFNEAF